MFGWIKLQPVIKGILLTICLCMGLIYGLPTFVNAQNKHLNSTACQSCHLAVGKVTPGNAYQLIDTQEHLCAECHADALAVSHASGFQTNRTLPAEYPIDWKGDLTCSSCHLVHSDNPGLMRGHKRGKELCLACHDIEFFYRMADGGISIQNEIHQTQSSDSFMSFIDSYSQHCIGCHVDSVRNTSNFTGEETDYVLAHGSTTMPHPIGLQYDASAKNRYRGSHELSEKIKLPDGKLSCITCHQAYDENHGSLVMSNKGSALCFQCHNL